MSWRLYPAAAVFNVVAVRAPLKAIVPVVLVKVVVVSLTVLVKVVPPELVTVKVPMLVPIAPMETVPTLLMVTLPDPAPGPVMELTLMVAGPVLPKMSVTPLFRVILPSVTGLPVGLL